MYENNVIKFFRNHWIKLLMSSILLLIIFVISGYGFISIKVDDASVNSDEISYTVLNQHDGSVSETKTTSKNLKKLVRKSDYEIKVTQNDKSSFAVVQSGGFFSNKTIGAKLTPESGRQFIGNNPKSCMYISNDVLYSYDCGGKFSTLQAHVPATSNQPTYTISKYGPPGFLGGVVKTSGAKTIALINNPIEDETDQVESAIHIAYSLKDGLVTGNGVVLKELVSSNNYSIVQYKKGFLIYDNPITKLLYYASVKTKPKEILMRKLSNDKLRPYSISVKNDSILVLYSTGTELLEDSSPVALDEISSTAVLYENGKTKQFDFSQQFSVVMKCSSDKLCTLKENLFSVYDISKGKPVLDFTINNVNSFYISKGRLLVAREAEILNINVDQKEGYIDFSFGDNKFCGLQPSDKGYILCLTNNNGNNVAVFIDPLIKNSGSIDKKIAVLENNPNINTVSVYRKYIFISPNFGEVSYQSSLGEFGYDPSTVSSVSAKINKEIDKIGIDRKAYDITVIGGK